jgi:hypothetical protein
MTYNAIFRGNERDRVSYSARHWLNKNLQSHGYFTAEGRIVPPDVTRQIATATYVGEVCASMAAHPGVVRWADEEEYLASGVSKDDFEAYQEFFYALEAVNEELKGLHWAFRAYKSAVTGLEEAARTNTRLLRGFFVYMHTSRRNVYGVVTSGYGKTAHVTSVPRFQAMAMAFVTMSNGGPHAVGQILADWHDGDHVWTQKHAWNPEEGVQRFTLGDSSTGMTVLGTPEMYKRARRYSEKISEIKDASIAEARTAHKSVIEWQEAGGTKALTRSTSVARVGPTIENQFKAGLPEALKHYYSDRNNFIREALADLDEASVEIVRSGARRRLLESIGGPLTDEEIALVDSAPPEGERDLDIQEVSRRTFIAKIQENVPVLASIIHLQTV